MDRLLTPLAILIILFGVATVVNVPIFTEGAADLPPIVLWNGETGNHYGQNSIIQEGGAHGGLRCFRGYPPADGIATFMVNSGPLDRPYLTFWARADRDCQATVSIQASDGSVSSNVPISLTADWSEMNIALTNFGLTNILHFRVANSGGATANLP